MYIRIQDPFEFVVKGIKNNKIKNKNQSERKRKQRMASKIYNATAHKYHKSWPFPIKGKCIFDAY